MRRRKRILSMGAVGLIAFAMGATTVVVAGSVPLASYQAGSTITRVQTATNTDRFDATDPSNTDVPGARLRFVSKQSMLMTYRFAATILCSGVPGRCHAQVAVLDNRNADAQFTTIFGVTHMDSTFGEEGHESHVAEGSVRLPAGDYDFQVQLTSFVCCDATGSVSVDIPMWHFTMEQIV